MSELTRIKIESVEERKMKNGDPYFSVSADNQMFSCFAGMRWMDKFQKAVGQEIDLQEWGLTIQDKGKYLNIVEIDERPAKKPYGGSKSEAISSAINRREAAEESKAQRISAAMDRNEWMYAKHGAALIIATNPIYQKLVAFKDIRDVEMMISHLANFILELEPGKHVEHTSLEDIDAAMKQINKTNHQKKE